MPCVCVCACLWFKSFSVHLGDDVIVGFDGSFLMNRNRGHKRLPMFVANSGLGTADHPLLSLGVWEQLPHGQQWL